jgi:hypothetical protein
MSPDEQRLIAGLFDRTRAAASAPRDPDADRFIQEQMRAQPHAAYVLTQAVIVQEEALTQANQRIQELEARLADMERQGQTAQSAPQAGGFFGGLFGRQQPATPPMPAARGSVPAAGFGARGAIGAPPMPAQGGYAPPGTAPQGGPWAAAQAPQQGGGGFLKGAMAAAAGVAGGALLFEGIKSAMGGSSIFGGGSHAGSGGQPGFFGGSQQHAAAPPLDNYGGIGDAAFDSGGRPGDLASSGIGDASFEADASGDDFTSGDFGDASFE